MKTCHVSISEAEISKELRDTKTCPVNASFSNNLAERFCSHADFPAKAQGVSHHGRICQERAKFSEHGKRQEILHFMRQQSKAGAKLNILRFLELWREGQELQQQRPRVEGDKSLPNVQ